MFSSDIVDVQSGLPVAAIRDGDDISPSRQPGLDMADIEGATVVTDPLTPP